MGTISLTSPVAGTTITAGLHATNYTTIQTVINGNLDANNWAAGKIFAPSKLLQEGAASNQVLAWNGTIWAPSTPTSSPNYGTTLPGSPTDGQEAILVDSITLPTYQWRFRWNNGSSNTDKWEFTGGAPAVVAVDTLESTTSTTYVALTTAGPSFTVPRAGVYEVEVRCAFTGNSSQTRGFMSYDIGGTGAVDADGIETVPQGANEQTFDFTRVKSGLAASTALTCKYKLGAANSCSFARRQICVLPIRVS
jgi:hypothetical protein